jgi:DNA-binding MarR family transcriptional regulator/GNAT superfamily N-acetyltransferase
MPIGGSRKLDVVRVVSVPERFISLTKVREMTIDQISAVRSFNRTVTERIGALDDRYLSRGRALGASRVLWEIGEGGTDARSLRIKLGLDSGYLSRLLRSLEGEGLVTMTRDLSDARVRVAHLTKKGARERELLGALSDELAKSLLDPLDDAQRVQLLEAAGTVERLLIAGLVEIRVDHPDSDAARFCIGEYFRELDARFEAGFDPARTIPLAAEELVEPTGVFLIARVRQEPVGCGGLRLQGNDPAEVKRMWVSDQVRGLGLGRRILMELERQAVSRGVSTLRLETNRALVEAINLYRSAGYQQVPAFNDEPFAHLWLEKRIGGPPGPPARLPSVAQVDNSSMSSCQGWSGGRFV